MYSRTFPVFPSEHAYVVSLAGNSVICILFLDFVRFAIVRGIFVYVNYYVDKLKELFVYFTVGDHLDFVPVKLIY